MPQMPTVLLLGDSIRMSYQPLVADLLEGKAAVVGPSDNCQFTEYTLSSLGRWLDELGQPDIVHWNNGIHDSGHNPARDPMQVPLDVFRANLECILERLTAAASQVIWATITPVHPDRPFTSESWSWRNEEIDQYNAAATELMSASNIPINDLHQLVSTDLDGYLAEDHLHLSQPGQQACAQAVAQAVSALLPGV